MLNRYILMVGFLGIVLAVSGCGKKDSVSGGGTPVTLPSGLTITDTKIGDGNEVTTGSRVSIKYVGKLDNGTVFDATGRHNNQPLEFVVGSGGVIPGMDQGVMGMKVGGKRDIVIPPDLGYGDDDMGPIPPNSTLHFSITLESSE